MWGHLHPAACGALYACLRLDWRCVLRVVKISIAVQKIDYCTLVHACNAVVATGASNTDIHTAHAGACSP